MKDLLGAIPRRQAATIVEGTNQVQRVIIAGRFSIATSSSSAIAGIYDGVNSR
jgi:hypothetical protein